MPNFNQVILMGNLTRDPEIKHTAGNQAVCNAGIAVNRRWRTAEGEDREEVYFADLTIWGKTGEAFAKYLAKGRPVFVVGRLGNDSWEDKDGKKQTKTRITVDSFQFIDGKQESNGDAPAPAKPADKPRSIPVSNRAGSGGYAGATPPGDIDVPFAPNMQWA